MKLLEAIREHRVIEALQLLQIKEIRESASENNNAALLLAAQNNLTEVIIELLKIKAVREAAADLSGVLYVLAGYDNTVAVIELLKVEAVRKALAADRQALLNAGRGGNAAIVIEFLKIKAVQDAAAAEDNLELRMAAREGKTAIVDVLLQIKAVQDAAAVRNNEALLFAADRGYTEIVFRLLRIKAVRDDAAAFENHALRAAARNRHWPMFLELLKCEAARNQLALKNHEVLRSTLAAGEFGIVSLLMDIYGEKEIPIPHDLHTEFRTKSLLDEKRPVACQAALVNDIYRHKGANLLTLLEDKNVQNCAALGQNLVLIFAVRNGLNSAVLKLLEIKSVCENVAVNDNDLFRCAAAQGHLQVVQTLLTLEPVCKLAATKNNQALQDAMRLQNWPMARELLRVEAVKDSRLSLPHNELLRMAATAGEVDIVLLLIQNYTKHSMIIPCYLSFTFGDGSIQSLSTQPLGFSGPIGLSMIEEYCEKAYKSTCDILNTHALELINIIMMYAGIPTKPTSTLLLSGGPSTHQASATKELMDNLRTLKDLMKSDTENKEAVEGCLSRIRGLLNTHGGRIPSDTYVTGVTQLSTLIDDWFSGHGAVYARLKEIFNIRSGVTRQISYDGIQKISSKT